ncbi:MAG: phage portal protein, partial [Myxococcaceae bacterium]|nr:phage portal protein [Myxococcaceae bacterium]
KAVKPEYLTWDMQVQGIREEIQKLEEYFFMTSETAPAAFGMERDGSQVESGRALKFKAHRTVNKVQDARDEFAQAIRDLFRIAQALEGSANPAGVRVHWGDIIVEDNTEEVQNYVALKAAKLVSAERAIADLYDLTPAEAAEERVAILQDSAEEAITETPPPSSAPAAPIPGEENLPEAGSTPPPARPAAEA